MAALAVVEGLDVFEHRELQLEPRWPAAAVDELFLEGGEERLGDGVVVRVATGADRDRDPRLALQRRPNASETYCLGSTGPRNGV